ncbi:MAG: hydantoinase/oxoprolinase family protein [Chloroflexi bacterium]|nr:hydantoinase/oxoprolinase family protein [Chloroflexota bacterium]
MPMKYAIGVDTGGTFTDIVVLSDQGELTMAKAPTTPHKFALGVMDAIGKAAQALGTDLPGLLSQTRIVKHGSTVATNAMIVRRGAKVGLITTKGFEDTTLIMRAIGRVDGLSEEEIRHVMRVTKPEPIVPRERIRGVRERIDYQGQELVPLNENDVRLALKDLIENEGVEAIAVSLLQAWANPAHEMRIKELCHHYKHNGQEIFYSFGSDLSRVAGEYARANTAILNSYVGPVVHEYLEGLEQNLRDKGLTGNFLVMQGNGNVASREHATPISNVQSGPAGGIMAGAYMAGLLGHPHVITTDMGGTSFDVGLITDGFWRYANEPIVERFRVHQPLVQVESVGAGGGTIARVDESTGRLLVGPASAAASPGPACYDVGGTEATVTDADVVLGIIDPNYFLGGQRQLHAGKAKEALDRNIARPMGIDTMEAAAGIYDIINSKMADLIRRQVVQVGYLPEEFVLYSFGGAGPTHAVGYAADLGVKKIYVFSTSPVFSAFGIATADAGHTRVATCQLIMPVKAEAVNAVVEPIEAELLQAMKAEGFAEGSISFKRFFNMRYRRQSEGCEIPVPWARFTEAEVPALQKLFESKYEELYGQGAGYARAGIEISGVRVDALGAVPKPNIRPQEYVGTDASKAAKGSRTVYFTRPSLKAHTATIYEYYELAHGNRIQGPAIVESPFTTVTLPPVSRATVDSYRNLVIEV